jgi:hypothetical protein
MSWQNSFTLRQLYSSQQHLYLNKLVTYDSEEVCTISDINSPVQVAYASAIIAGLATASEIRDLTGRLFSRQASVGFYCDDHAFSFEPCNTGLAHSEVWIINNLLLTSALKSANLMNWAEWLKNETLALMCNVSSILGDNVAETGVFSRVFQSAGYPARPVPDMFSTAAASSAATTLVLDHLNDEQKNPRQPPISHNVTFALMIVVLVFAFGIGSSCFIFSLNLLRRLKDTDSAPALLDDLITPSDPLSSSSTSHREADYCTFSQPPAVASSTRTSSSAPAVRTDLVAFFYSYAQYLRLW